MQKSCVCSKDFNQQKFSDHACDVNSPKKVWDALKVLFSKKNTTRLQFLGKEIGDDKVGRLSISKYFPKVKNICDKISE